MRCDKCDRPAVVQVTDIRGGKPADVHLCEACADDAYAIASTDRSTQSPSLQYLLITMVLRNASEMMLVPRPASVDSAGNGIEGTGNQAAGCRGHADVRRIDRAGISSQPM